MTKGFDNARNQIGFCGIWCGSCLGGNDAIQELTRKYEQVIKRSQSALERWAPEGFNYDEFIQQLGYVQAMPLCPGCKKGGGNPACGIRTCASKKSISNCSQCMALEQCVSFQPLEEINPRMKEELQAIRNTNDKELIEKWIGELRTKWPHCVLLCETPKK